jgi:hypothetical protein
MGFTTILLPRKNADRISDVPAGVRLVPLQNVKEAVRAL